jgi:hypothetical protein
MGSISDFLENELLDHIFNADYSPPANVFVALSTADPTDDGSGISEPSGGAYSRATITFSTAASRAVQSKAVTFSQATAAWGLITHYAIYDQVSGGNMMAHGALGASKNVVNGNTPSLAATEIQISVSANEVSDYLSIAILDFAFRNQSFTRPDIYIALTTVNVTDGDTGSSITEPSGGAYDRTRVYKNGGTSPTWDLASLGALDNGAVIQFPTPTASWGTVVATAVVDAASAGNLLFYDNGVTDQSCGIDDDVEFAAGAFDVALT